MGDRHSAPSRSSKHFRRKPQTARSQHKESHHSPSAGWPGFSQRFSNRVRCKMRRKSRYAIQACQHSRRLTNQVFVTPSLWSRCFLQTAYRTIRALRIKHENGVAAQSNTLVLECFRGTIALRCLAGSASVPVPDYPNRK